MRHSARSLKAGLLPLPADLVRDASLSARLAFETCRSGQGSRDQFFQLIRVTYLSYLLWQAGYGQATHALYADTEQALEIVTRHAYTTGHWRLNGDAIRLMLEVMCIYDTQLNSVLGRDYLENTIKLEQLLRVDIPGKTERMEPA
jgi:hypothetical protein